MGSANPWKVVMSPIRKLAEEFLGKTALGNAVLSLLPELLPRLLFMLQAVKIDTPNKALTPQGTCGHHVFITTADGKLGQ